MSLLLRLEHKQKNSSNTFRIRIFLFLSYSFGIETINTFIHSVVPSKTIPDSRPKWAKSIPVSDQNGAKSLPDGTSHTYMTYMKEYPPPPPSRAGSGNIEQNLDLVFANNSVQEAMPQIAAMVAFLYFCCNSFATSDNFSFYLLSRHSSSLTKIRKET